MRGSQPLANGKIAKKPDDAEAGWRCNFFTECLSQNVLTWRLKYISEGREGNNAVLFGVARKLCGNTEDADETYGCFINSHDGGWFHPARHGNPSLGDPPTGGENTESICAGSEVEITLDFTKRELAFAVDGKHRGTYTDLDTSQPLGLAVLLCYPGAEVKLLEVRVRV